VTTFKFPPEVRAPCEQYLMYFGQFLRDLGMSAETHLREEAGSVLFSVTPTEGSEALARIQQALGVYLELPTQVEGLAGGGGAELAVQRLEANILHLRAQLLLSQATVQAHQATIQLLQAAGAVRQALPGTSFLGGAVSLVPIEGHGVRVDLPDLFRRLREYFGGGRP